VSETHDRADKVPGTFKQFVARFPELGKAHEQIAAAVEAAGPLDRKMQELIKIGLSVGAGLESGVRAHIRRALREGASPAEIEQSILLAYNTCGWPRMVAAWRWMNEQLGGQQGSDGGERAPSGA